MGFEIGLPFVEGGAAIAVGLATNAKVHSKTPALRGLVGHLDNRPCDFMTPPVSLRFVVQLHDTRTKESTDEGPWAARFQQVPAAVTCGNLAATRAG